MYVVGNEGGTTGQPQRSINMGVYGINLGIEVFYKRYFGKLGFHVRYCGIIQPCGIRFCIFWLKVFGKRRSLTVLRYHLFALSCLIQVNTMCSPRTADVSPRSSQLRDVSRGGTLAKRPSEAMSEEKLLPFAGYTMCNNSIKAKQVNKS